MPVIARQNSPNETRSLFHKPVGPVELDRSHPLAQGLKALYLLNDSSARVAKNLVGGGIEPDLGTGTARPLWRVRGRGRTLFFDGSNDTCFASGVPAQFATIHRMTIAAMVTLTATGGTGLRPAFSLSRATDTSAGYKLGYNITSNVWQLSLDLTATTTQRIITGPAPTLNQPAVLVGVTRSDVQTNFWMNGIIRGTATLTIGTVGSTFDRTSIGHDVNTGIVAAPLNGDVHMAAVWNRPLTTAEIRSFSAAPFQMVKSPRYRRPFVSVVASGTTNFVTASASLIAIGTLTRLPLLSESARLNLAASRTAQISKLMTAIADLAATRTYVVQTAKDAALLLAASVTVQLTLIRTMTASLVVAATRTNIVTKSLAASLALVASRVTQLNRSLSASLPLPATRSYLVQTTKSAVLLLAASATAQFVVVRSLSASLLLRATQSEDFTVLQSLTARLNLAASHTKQIATSLAASLGLAASRNYTVQTSKSAQLNLAATSDETASFLVNATAQLILAASVATQFVYTRTLNATFNLSATQSETFIPGTPAAPSDFIGRFKGMIANLGKFMGR